jgi:hypothetical protein
MSLSYSKLFVGISLPVLCTGLASLLLSISANAQTIRPTTQKELKVFDPTPGNSGNIGIRAAAGTLSYTLTLPAARPTANQVLSASAVTGGNVSLTWATPVSGTVTSVGLSVPTGFSVSSSPVTSAGTLSLSYASGYALPTTTSQTNWDGAYNDRITAASVTGTTTKTITLTQQDGGTVTATLSDLNTDAVTSVFGRTGSVTSTTGDYTTAQITESGNLYYTDLRARDAISLATTGSSGAATYDSTTGVLTIPNYTLTGLGGVGGSGTLNYLSKFTNAGTLTNSLLFDNGTNVGIGTETPVAKFSVSDLTGFNFGTIPTSPVIGNLWYFTDGTSWRFQIGKRHNNNFTPQMTFHTNNNIGIGTTSPGQRLEVNGNIMVTDKIGFRYSENDASLYAYLSRPYNGLAGPLTIAGGFETATMSSEAIRFETASAGSAKMSILNNGNVGIGTTSPTYLLHINSSISPSNSQARFTANGVGGFSILAYSVDNIQHGYDADWTNNSWIARSTTAARIFKNAEGLSFATNSGLTPGVAFSPTPRLMILHTGKVSVGDTDPIGRFEVKADPNDTEVLEIEDQNERMLFRVTRSGDIIAGNLTRTSGGNIPLNVTISGVLTTTASDIRLKTNIEVIPNALQKVMDLRGVTYNWKDGRDTTRVLGMIAQEMLKVAPELVFQNNNGYYGIHYAETTGLLVEAIKEQQKIIEHLKAEQAATDTLIRQLQLDLQAIRKLNTAPKD